jgi:hypothetical protein
VWDKGTQYAPMMLLLGKRFCVYMLLCLIRELSILLLGKRFCVCVLRKNIFVFDEGMNNFVKKKILYFVFERETRYG